MFRQWPARADGSLTPAQCAAIPPRPEAITGQFQHDAGYPVHQRRVDDSRRLVTVTKCCLDKDVELLFG